MMSVVIRDIPADHLHCFHRCDNLEFIREFTELVTDEPHVNCILYLCDRAVLGQAILGIDKALTREPYRPPEEPAICGVRVHLSLSVLGI